MAKAQYWMGQKILFQSTLFGKEYFFMQDHDGTIWLAGAEPVYEGFSVNGLTGETEPIFVGYRPKIII